MVARPVLVFLHHLRGRDYLLGGELYDIAIWLVMNLVALPLSALHNTGPFEYGPMVQGLVVHMALVGLPISFSVKKFAP